MEKQDGAECSKEFFNITSASQVGVLLVVFHLLLTTLLLLAPLMCLHLSCCWRPCCFLCLVGIPAFASVPASKLMSELMVASSQLLVFSAVVDACC
jgi:hypothetical protein